MITEAYTDSPQGFFNDSDEGVFIYEDISGPKETKASWEAKSFGKIIPCTKKEFESGNISQHLPGTKLDHEKPKLDLVLGDFAKALVEVGKVGTMGANKYSEHGWLSVENAETRYLSAALRHYYNHKDEDEDDIDPESNLPHLAHMAWNALAVLELYLRKQK